MKALNCASSWKPIDKCDRFDENGRIMFMVESGGYVMCKRPRCMPFVVSIKAWEKMSFKPVDSGAKP